MSSDHLQLFSPLADPTPATIDPNSFLLDPTDTNGYLNLDNVSYEYTDSGSVSSGGDDFQSPVSPSPQSPVETAMNQSGMSDQPHLHAVAVSPDMNSFTSEASSSPSSQGVKLEPQAQLINNLIHGMAPGVAHLGYPISTMPLDPDTFRELMREQNMKKARLARKAELARMSRRRKKGRLSELEVEVNRLKEELERERKQRKLAHEQLLAVQSAFGRSPMQVAPVEAAPTAPVSPPEVTLADEWKQQSDALRKILSEGGSSPQCLQDAARTLTDMAANVKRRSAVPLTQTAAVQKTLTQPLPLRFLEWIMNQKDQFYQDQSGLWHSLFQREMGLSPEQIASVLLLRQPIQAQRTTSMEVQSSYAALTAAMQSYCAQSGSNLDKFVALLTPEQLCKFFSWVDNYGSVVVQINV